MKKQARVVVFRLLGVINTALITLLIKGLVLHPWLADLSNHIYWFNEQ